MTDLTELEYARFLAKLDGAMDRQGLSADSGLGAAWKLGDDAVALAQSRIAEKDSRARPSLRSAVVQRQHLNALATRLPRSYAVTQFWPLPLTLQGIAAAIWASAGTAPWIGDVGKLRPTCEFDARFPPGFDLYLAILGKEELRPQELRSGVRIKHIDAIVAAGEERWEAFLATWMASINFVWGHELAHVLYGHTDLAAEAFGVDGLYEGEGIERLSMPQALSQFMEYVADVDASLNIFTAFYGKLPDSDAKAVKEHANIGACTVLGIFIALYALMQSAALNDAVAKGATTHPPLRHRLGWVIGAESLALDKVAKKSGGAAHLHQDMASIVRPTSSALLRSVAVLHESLHSALSILDTIEPEMHEFLARLKGEASPFFDDLDRHQMV